MRSLIGWPWVYFAPAEVLSPEGLSQLNKNNLMIQPEALDLLQHFRSVIGKAFFINHGDLHFRGYRSPEENSRVGGAKFSRHIQGIAFDITIKDMTVSQAAQAAEAFGWFVLPYHEKNFIHIDSRPKC